MIEAYKKYWTSYVDFKGKTSRADFWWAFLANVICSVIVSVLAVVFSLLNLQEVGTVLESIWLLATIIPSLSIAVRRFRDAGKSWANIFWPLLPIAGIIVYIVKLCAPSKAE